MGDRVRVAARAATGAALAAVLAGAALVAPAPAAQAYYSRVFEGESYSQCVKSRAATQRAGEQVSICYQARGTFSPLLRQRTVWVYSIWV